MNAQFWIRISYSNQSHEFLIPECYILNIHAEVAHLVEHNLAKVRVAGSSPVFRSLSLRFDVWGLKFYDIEHRTSNLELFKALVVELVDTQDLKSCSPKKRVRVRFPPRALSRSLAICFFLAPIFKKRVSPIQDVEHLAIFIKSKT